MKTHHFLALLYLIVLVGCDDQASGRSFWDAVVIGLGVAAVVLFAIGGKRGML